MEIEAVIDLAQRAGDEIMEVYKTGDFKVESKSDNSPLTIADHKSSEIICSGLHDLDPSIPVINEERQQEKYSVRKKYKNYWLVDPLDGTKEFIKKNNEFTVNIALCEGHRPILGVVYVPALELTYYAEKGAGAFKVTHQMKKQLKVLDFKAGDENLTIVASRSHINERTQSYINQFKGAKTTTIGSSLKLMLVAEGKAHLYPRLGPTSEWDTAAPQIIVEEAGGSVVQYDSHEPLQYNKENLLNPWFIVYGGIDKLPV